MLEPRTAPLLHVEDDDVCIMGLAREFKKARLANPISFVHDGIDALEMLRGANGREQFPRPHSALIRARGHLNLEDRNVRDSVLGGARRSWRVATPESLHDRGLAVIFRAINNPNA